MNACLKLFILKGICLHGFLFNYAFNYTSIQITEATAYRHHTVFISVSTQGISCDNVNDAFSTSSRHIP